MAAGAPLAKENVRELWVTFILDAPREVVFRAWTDPIHVARWWGPNGFTNPACEVDARPSGSILIPRQGPDGEAYPMTGIYVEVIEPERIVFTIATLDGKGNPLVEIENSVTFEKQGSKTKQTLRARVLTRTAGTAPYLAGMEVGWTQSLERLAAHVKAQSKE